MDHFAADDIEAFADWWLTGGRKRRSESTLVHYRQMYRRFLAWADREGESTFTIRSARRFIGECRQASEWTAIEATRALKTYGRWIAHDDPDTGDPMAALEHLARPETERTPIAELADIEKLLETCDGSMEGTRDRAIICLLRATGVRRGELSLMLWEHVDRNACTLYLPPGNTKSGKGRTVCFDRDTQQALRLYVRRLERWEDANCRDFSHTDRVWLGRLGPLTSNGIGQMIERRAARAEVDITAHSFRRSLAVRWLREGRSETLLQRVAGWSDPKMVGRYTKVVQEAESIAQQRALLASEASERRRQSVVAGAERGGSQRRR